MLPQIPNKNNLSIYLFMIINKINTLLGAIKIFKDTILVYCKVEYYKFLFSNVLECLRFELGASLLVILRHIATKQLDVLIALDNDSQLKVSEKKKTIVFSVGTAMVTIFLIIKKADSTKQYVKKFPQLIKSTKNPNEKREVVSSYIKKTDILYKTKR